MANCQNIISEDFKKIFDFTLYQWFEENRRDFPWRNTQDPYIIWISEIILQQTQIKQGYDYFIRFIKRFPTVKSLAEAEETEVLKLWQGLGYYSRARNLYASAQLVMNHFNGKFPTEYKDILSLKGIGKYTAAAIASFAYNQPYAVVDGNVYRFLARLFAIDEYINTPSGEKLFYDIASQLISHNQPRLHNQAIMEFGEVCCTPHQPNCEACPFANNCLSLANNTIFDYPKKKSQTVKRNRYFYYLCFLYKNNTFIQQRQNKDIWHGLYEFPLIESNKELNDKQLFENEILQKLNGTIKQRFKLEKHILSHQNIFGEVLVIEIKDVKNILSKYKLIKNQEIWDFPVSRLIEKAIFLIKDFEK